MRAERQAAFAFGVAGIVGVLSTTAVIQLSRMLFSILRSSYNEALRGMHQVAAKINSDSPGVWRTCTQATCTSTAWHLGSKSKAEQ